MVHALLFLLLLLSTSTADDGHAMLMLAKSLYPLPPGWSTTSSAGLCTDWKWVLCDSSNRVISIELSNQGLTGTLPFELFNLTQLIDLSLSGNNLSGDLSHRANLSNLETLSLDYNNLASISSNFFQGLTSIKDFRISNNTNLAPWKFPVTLPECTRLRSFIADSSNMIGQIPDIFSFLPNLTALSVGSNNLEGPLPKSLANSRIKDLGLHDQWGFDKRGGLSGTIEVIGRMRLLSRVWLAGNKFTGPIPDLTNCPYVFDFQLQNNHLTGIVPASLVSLPLLLYVSLTDNKLQGPAPMFPSNVLMYNESRNHYCAEAGVPCDRQVTILLQIAADLGYPELLSDSWIGNDACNWTFVTCDTKSKNIVTVNLSRQHFVGTISPAFADLTSLKNLYLNDNNLTGAIPDSLTSLKQLNNLDVSNNNLSGKVPEFPYTVNLTAHPGNLLLQTNSTSPSGSTSRGSSKIGLPVKIAIAILTPATMIVIVLSFAMIMRERSPCRKESISWRMKAKDNKNIEIFIMKYHSAAPKQFSYTEIKRITRSFSNKVGEGGFGDVYKGQLADGRVVAVKVLNKSKGDGQDFINEVASISRTSHVNVVALLGFCYERNRRALIYEYMPNGSLDKFIYDQESLGKHRFLEWKILYEIAVGIARGLEYLHRDCSTRIVHFDIKPHNILLDEDFCPKISDFGLAKLCKRKESKVSMTGARGTAGYVAPEVVCRNIGTVSSKSDVYSYGMMVLEMVGGRHNVEEGVSDTSRVFFPDWIHKHLKSGDVCSLYGVLSDEEEQMVGKMILVGLWCIQTNPLERPSMTKVVEMLESGHQSLQIPLKPFQSPPVRLSQDLHCTLSSPPELWSHQDEEAGSVTK